MAQMVLLAGPGVLISTFFLGAALKVGHYYLQILIYLEVVEIWSSNYNFMKDWP